MMVQQSYQRRRIDAPSSPCAELDPRIHHSSGKSVFFRRWIAGEPLKRLRFAMPRLSHKGRGMKTLAA